MTGSRHHAGSRVATKAPTRSPQSSQVADDQFYKSFSEKSLTTYGAGRRSRIERHRLDLLHRFRKAPGTFFEIGPGHGTLLHRSLDGPHLWLLRHCTSPMALIPAADRSERAAREEADATG